MNKIYSIILLFAVVITACKPQKKEDKSKDKKMDSQVMTLSDTAKQIRDRVTKNIVIAHRGSTYFTPEETEPAFRWARNIGADYLEFDVQLTKDSILVAFHDKNLKRTTDVASVFPDRKEGEINDFTLKELRKLDVGSWFNSKNPDRAKDKFKGLKILTLKDVVMIAEGYKLQYRNGKPVKEVIKGEWTGQYLYEKDNTDKGNRPGIYVETKNPKPNVERILARDITALGWNINSNPKEIETQKGKVAVANTEARFILQTFSHNSIKQLEKYLPNIPKCLLLWQPDMKDDLKANYKEAIRFSIENNVEIMGPSIAGAPNNYKELTAPWMADMVHDAGMLMHSYTFDTNEQLKTYQDRVDGVFTNRSDLALNFYHRKSTESAEKILENLGY